MKIMFVFTFTCFKSPIIVFFTHSLAHRDENYVLQVLMNKKGAPKTEEQDGIAHVSYFTLFKFATTRDKWFIRVALLLSAICGLCATFNNLLLAQFLQYTVDYAQSKNGDVLLSSAKMFTIQYCVNAVAVIVLTYASTVLMNVAAARQVYLIRVKYLEAALSQDFSYYDVQQPTDFASKMTNDAVKIEDGIGEKLTTFVYFVSNAVTCVLAAFIRDWWFTLLCLIMAPATIVFVGISAFVAGRYAKKEAVALGQAGAIAEEVLSAVRTVYAFNGQRLECERYQRHLEKARSINELKALFNGIAQGSVFLCAFCSYGLSFWYGYKLIRDDPKNYDASVIFGIFFWVLTGFSSIGSAVFMIDVFGTACGAGKQVFNLILNKPLINPLLDRGLVPTTVQGNIEFKDVVFNYPSRPYVAILKRVTLTVTRGQSVALVGHSGCGKSTMIQLICRYYDVINGSVSVDGRDVRDLSVRWLRAQVGLVGQEPVLFNTTVRENIRYGRQDATDADIEAVARQANAHHFIMKLPKGYDTLVGERGASLSGGQKQRIAIARALVRDPRILLLDEATSALDTASEAKVQQALDKAQQGRTTIIVAHRLSTVRKVDVIHVFVRGRLMESGTHTALMGLKGHYYDMIVLQGLSQDTASESSTALEKQSKSKSLESTIKEYQLNVATEDNVGIQEKLPDESFWSIVGLNKPEWKSIAFASACALLFSAGMPTIAILFGDYLNVLSEPVSDETEVGVKFCVLMYVIMGVCLGSAMFVQTYFFGRAGEGLTKRLRSRMFESLLKQEVAFFDNNSNSTGALCARLSGEAATVQGATGLRIGLVVQAFGSVTIGAIISVIYEWHVGLFIVCLVPIFGLVMYQEAKMVSGQSSTTASIMESSSKLAVEAVANIRTVASLGREHTVLNDYESSLVKIVEMTERAAHYRGLVFGLSRGYMNMVCALAFYYGTTLAVNDNVPLSSVFTSIQSMINGTNSSMAALAYSPNFQKAFFAGKRIIVLLKRIPTITDPVTHRTGLKITGQATFSEVYFKYPSRPMVQVLKGLNLEIPREKTIALVGASGCGKSTVIQLLQRYYDPNDGLVTLDEAPIKEFLLSDLRQAMGFVQQEPVLFDRTIGENISYGDNTRSPSMDEIIAVAKQANIHGFISSLPQGYDTNIGNKGTQLSGGQKQRIAIARALIRRPKMLLLDEATSALDTESEKVVQDALDNAKKNRTCVTIAHRLSTIRDADVICVVHEGRVAEQGTHSELMAAKGMYYVLNQ